MRRGAPDDEWREDRATRRVRRREETDVKKSRFGEEQINGCVARFRNQLSSTFLAMARKLATARKRLSRR